MECPAHLSINESLAAGDGGTGNIGLGCDLNSTLRLDLPVERPEDLEVAEINVRTTLRTEAGFSRVAQYLDGAAIKTGDFPRLVA